MDKSGGRSNKRRASWRFTTLGGHHPSPEVPQPRLTTLSIALPADVLSNCQTLELKTLLIGQVARAAAIYEVDEVVLWGQSDRNKSGSQLGPAAVKGGRRDDPSEAVEIFARVLQYLETPQYLRRQLVPMHRHLRCVGLLAPLDAPHHVRQSDRCPFREGVVLRKESGEHFCLVNCGLPRPLKLDRKLEANMRVTVKVTDYGHFEGSRPKKSRKKFRDTGSHNWSEPAGVATSPDAPREELGLYWGYQVRIASSLSDALNGCPWEGGYDLRVGTSEKGNVNCEDDGFDVKKHKHALVVFGGLEGIEASVEEDGDMDDFQGRAHELFDHWVNTCPTQGSRTIRTEEAILISLAKLQTFLRKANEEQQ